MKQIFVSIILLVSVCLNSHAISSRAYLKPENGHRLLMVDEKPFIIIGAQINPWWAYGGTPATAQAREQFFDISEYCNMSVVGIPLMWGSCVEVTQDQYSMDALHYYITKCEEHHMKMVLIFMGSVTGGTANGYNFTPQYIIDTANQYYRNADGDNTYHWVRGAGTAGLSGLDYYSICPNSPGFQDRSKKALQRVLEYLRDYDVNRTVIAIEIDSEIGSYLFAVVNPDDPNNSTDPYALGKRQGENQNGHRCRCNQCNIKYATFDTDYPQYKNDPEHDSKFMAVQFANHYKGSYDLVKSSYPIPTYCNQINSRLWQGWRYEEDPSVFLSLVPSIDFAGPTVMKTEQIQWLIDDLGVFMNLPGVPAGRNISFIAEADTGYQPNIEATFWYPVYQYYGIGGLLWDTPGYDNSPWDSYLNPPLCVNSIINSTAYQSKLRVYNGPYKAMMSQVAKYAYPGSTYSAWWGYQTNVGGTVNGIPWWVSNTNNRRGGIIAAEPQDLTVSGWTYTFDMVAAWINTSTLQVERGYWDGFTWNGAQTQPYTKSQNDTKLTTTFNGDDGDWTKAAIRVFTSKIPAFTSTVTTDPDTIYYKGETITLVTTWDSSAYRLTADFSQVDSVFYSTNVTVVPLGDKKYKITYTISANNTRNDGLKTVPVTANNYSINGGTKLSPNNSFTVTYKTQPAAIACSASPASITADNTMTSNITATVNDINNNPVSLLADNISFNITGPGTWASTGTTETRNIAPVNGAATIRIKSTSLPGTITVTASIPGLAAANALVTANAGTPVKVLANSNPAMIVANGISMSTITTNLVDNNNNVILSATNPVIFSITGQGTWSDSGTVETRNITSAGGSATIGIKSSTQVGQVKVNCNSYGLEGSTITVITTTGPAYKIRRKKTQ
jgi:hypothetical protein